jgi:hypothetical protein
VVQNNLATKVTRGENEGRTPHHDFVVRQWLPSKPIGSDGSATVARVMPLPGGASVADFAVSACVQSANGEILQAFSLRAGTPPGIEKRNFTAGQGSNRLNLVMGVASCCKLTKFSKG